LNRRQTGLDLPASEIGSIVGNRELDVMHRQELSHGRFGHLERRAPQRALAALNLRSKKLAQKLDTALSKLKKRC
jgi:hypothetical protein